MTVDIEIPPNTRATVRLPSAKMADVTEDSKRLDAVEGIMEKSQDGDTVVICVGSGRYSFQYTK
jgi:alpha-L-rhamnosidase